MVIDNSPNPRQYDYSLYYRAWHNDSDEHVAQMAAGHRKQLSPFLPSPSSAPVLDIGCGMGFAMTALQGLGFTDVYGIDTDEQQVRTCQRRGLAVELVADTVSFLENRVGRYGVVLMLDVLEHLRPDRQIYTMRAVWRALTGDGRVILTMPNASSILASRHRYNDYTHYSSFTEHSLRFVLANAGFGKIVIAGQGPLGRPPLALWKRSGRQVLRKWLVRLIWRQVLAAEVGGFENIDNISLDLNLFAVAYKLSSTAPEE